MAHPTQTAHGRRGGATPPDRVTIPTTPPDGLLMSMALRTDHALGCPGYYDQFEEGLHAKKLRAALDDMRRVYEEIVGGGFYSADQEAYYQAMLSSSSQGEDR